MPVEVASCNPCVVGLVWSGSAEPLVGSGQSLVYSCVSVPPVSAYLAAQQFFCIPPGEPLSQSNIPGTSVLIFSCLKSENCNGAARGSVNMCHFSSVRLATTGNQRKLRKLRNPGLSKPEPGRALSNFFPVHVDKILHLSWKLPCKIAGTRNDS